MGVLAFQGLPLDSFLLGREWWSFASVQFWRGDGRERTIKEVFNSFHFETVVVSKDGLFTFSTCGWFIDPGRAEISNFTLGGCGGHPLRNWIWTSLTLGGYGSPVRTVFVEFEIWWSCKDWFWIIFFQEDMVVLKELILENVHNWGYDGPVRTFWQFHLGRKKWSWKNWFWAVYSFGGYGVLGRTDSNVHFRIMW